MVLLSWHSLAIFHWNFIEPHQTIVLINIVFSCNLIAGRGSSYERVVQILAETPLVMRRTILEFPLEME